MNRCDQIQERLDAYVDRELDPRTRRRVEDHLSTCQVCGDECRRIASLVRNTGRLLAVSKIPEGFDDAVMASVMGRIRCETSRTPERTRRTLRRSAAWNKWRVGASLVWAHSSLVAAVSLLALTPVCVSRLEQHMVRPKTLVMAARSMAWNSHAWLDIQAFTDGDSNEPLSGARVRIQARRAAAGPWLTLYEGQTDVNGAVEASFCLPPELRGACELQVQTGDGWLRDHVVQSVTVGRGSKVLRC